MGDLYSDDGRSGEPGDGVDELLEDGALDHELRGQLEVEPDRVADGDAGGARNEFLILLS